VILNRIYVYHVSGMDSEQREKYDSDLYGWAETEADALAAVYEAAAMEAGGVMGALADVFPPRPDGHIPAQGRCREGS
jgi:hypothetical protein